MNPHDMQRVLAHLKRDPVVKAVHDAKSEEIGPNIFRFKAEIGALALSRSWVSGFWPRAAALKALGGAKAAHACIACLARLLTARTCKALSAGWQCRETYVL